MDKGLFSKTWPSIPSIVRYALLSLSYISAYQNAPNIPDSDNYKIENNPKELEWIKMKPNIGDSGTLGGFDIPNM